MNSIRHIYFIGYILLVVSTAFAQKPGWTTYKSDGTIKARAESDFQEGKIIKTVIFDSDGRIEFIERPTYDKDGKIHDRKRSLPDGSPWPYEYPVYGGAALGGIETLRDDIQMIQEAVSQIDTKYPILEICFVNADQVEVKTGIIKGTLNAQGRYHVLKKQGNSWQNADEPGMTRSWVS